MVVAAALCGGAASQAKASFTEPKVKQTFNDDGDQVYTLAQMKDMCEKESRIVCAHRGSLYDMTHFTGHPGGYGRLQMAAGHDLEVFWKVYTQHNRGHIVDNVMEPYKIGVVTEKDMLEITASTHFDNSAYIDNPAPYSDLLMNTQYPYNAEARLSTLTDSWWTPPGRHFVRNHSAVPLIDPDEYLLTVKGEMQEGVYKEATFTLEDLKTKFPKVDVTTVIQCNGNRREDYHYYDGETPAFGPPHWVAGAISNAQWSGVRLRDVLRASGMDVDAISLRQIAAPSKAKQIGLLGYDQDEVGNQYCCSFPFDKGLDPFGDVILAYEMNGQTIPRPYGYPVRCIVPGHAGARNCKYLQEVQITAAPCNGHSNWKQYAVHAPDVHMRKIAEFEDFKKELMQDPPVQEMPVQSLITSPCAGDIISAAKSGMKSVLVKGVAWGGGGSGINRVDVSLDEGQTFTKADLLEKPIEQARRSQWSWVFFEKEIPIPEDMRWKLQEGQRVNMVLASKALNAAWNIQPENPAPNVNAHGCCVNHWYRVPITVDPHAPDHIKAPDGDFGNKPSGGRFATRFRNFEQPAESHSRLEAERRSRTQICTCGLGCKVGSGCLSEVYMDSPSMLFERMRQTKNRHANA